MPGTTPGSILDRMKRKRIKMLYFRHAVKDGPHLPSISVPNKDTP
jgi:hypothetical protein